MEVITKYHTIEKKYKKFSPGEEIINSPGTFMLNPNKAVVKTCELVHENTAKEKMELTIEGSDNVYNAEWFNPLPVFEVSPYFNSFFIANSENYYITQEGKKEKWDKDRKELFIFKTSYVANLVLKEYIEGQEKNKKDDYTFRIQHNEQSDFYYVIVYKESNTFFGYINKEFDITLESHDLYVKTPAEANILISKYKEKHKT